MQIVHKQTETIKTYAEAARMIGIPKPTVAMLLDRGFALYEDTPTPEGFRRTGQFDWDKSDDSLWVRQWHTEPIPERVPDERLIGIAATFRAVLRLLFGDNAETDRDVTRDHVETTLMQQIGTGDAGARVEAAIVLERGFEAITAFSGSNEVWTFFERWGTLIDNPTTGGDDE